MGVEPEAELKQGRVEAGLGGVHQQVGAGQPLQFRGAAVEERGEVGQSDEVDPLEQVFGVEQGIAGQLVIEHHHHEAQRHVVAIGQLRETDQHRGAHRPKPEEGDRERCCRWVGGGGE